MLAIKRITMSTKPSSVAASSTSGQGTLPGRSASVASSTVTMAAPMINNHGTTPVRR